MCASNNHRYCLLSYLSLTQNLWALIATVILFIGKTAILLYYWAVKLPAIILIHSYHLFPWFFRRNYFKILTITAFDFDFQLCLIMIEKSLWSNWTYFSVEKYCLNRSIVVFQKETIQFLLYFCATAKISLKISESWKNLNRKPPNLSFKYQYDYDVAIEFFRKEGPHWKDS